MKNPILTLILFYFILSSFSQNSRNIESEDQMSYFLADVSYSNDAVFMGRRDSIRAPYLLPSIAYYDASGFYANASLSYLTRPDEGRVDLSLITVGYNFTRKKFTAGISGTAYFFNENSYNVQSEIVGDLTASVGYDFKVFEASAVGSSYFSDLGETDFFIGFRLDKTFWALEKNLLINPMITAYAGSQYFYEEYYKNNRLGNRKGSGRQNGMGSSATNSNTISIKEVDQFNVSSYEISIPIQYYYKSFIFSFMPEFALPQSKASIITEDQTFEEDLDNTFYWSMGMSYWISTKKGK